MAFALLATGLTFLAGRWALRKHLDKGFNKLRKMVAGLSLIINAENRGSENVSNQMGASQAQIDTKNPLSQIEIQEEKSNDKLDSETAQRNRSRT